MIMKLFARVIGGSRHNFMINGEKALGVGVGGPGWGAGAIF